MKDRICNWGSFHASQYFLIYSATGNEIKQ